MYGTYVPFVNTYYSVLYTRTNLSMTNNFTDGSGLLYFGEVWKVYYKTINQINMTFGSSKATLLSPNIFDANDNLYVNESFTQGGVSMTTTDHVGVVTFLNMYHDHETKETLLDISVNGPDNIVTVALCCLKIKPLKDC